jgi:polyribonucleotide nucleotidyltransferase
VLKILDFGAIVPSAGQGWSAAHFPDRQERVNKVEDYVKEGQVVRVKVLETDDRGRVKLSMKAAAAEEGAAAAAPAPEAGSTTAATATVIREVY